MNRHAEAAEAQRNALSARSNIDYCLGDLVYARMNAGAWADLESDWSRLVRGIRHDQPVARPFQTFTLPVTPADQLSCARAWCRREIPSSAPLSRGETYVHDRIRVAYVSSDFGEHPTSQLMVGLFEQHDRARFETIAVATQPGDGSRLRARLAKAFDHFIEAHDKSDWEIAQLLRRMEVDIAVDLNGHNGEARTRVFAHRPAPVQVSYLVYPGTMGADFIDYLIADRIVVPEAERAHYCEKIVWLPESYFVYDNSRPVPASGTTRAALGLPEDGFVFCCFNNSYKITPELFDLWMRLLGRVDRSVLWLLGSNRDFSENIKRETEARGIPAERVVFAPRVRPDQYLARYHHADLFLDTFHCNAHTTACDAMWMGLPVLTRIGETFAGRVAASLLTALGLPELIAHSAAEYEERALQFARTPPLMAATRSAVAANRRTRPLFDTRRSTRHAEAAYEQMMARHAQGRRPEHFAISPID